MNSHIQIINPDKVVASITLTMTVERWQDLRKAMDGQPYYGAPQQLRDAVDALVKRVSERLNYEPDASATEAKGCAK